MYLLELRVRSSYFWMTWGRIKKWSSGKNSYTCWRVRVFTWLHQKPTKLRKYYDAPIFVTSIAPIMFAGKSANILKKKRRSHDWGKVVKVPAVCSGSIAWTENYQEMRKMLLWTCVHENWCAKLSVNFYLLSGFQYCVMLCTLTISSTTTESIFFRVLKTQAGWCHEEKYLNL